MQTETDFDDTIVAQATPPGRGGVGIVRVSGKACKEVAEKLLGHCPKPRKAEYLPFYDLQEQLLVIPMTTMKIVALVKVLLET